jgi:uncharacterized protein YlxW (UPF0749 family)
MTDTIEPPIAEQASPPRTPERERERDRGLGLRVAVTLACAVLGFLLVAQVRATEEVGDRLAAEREEDLARILSELSGQSDRLQAEITDLRLTLLDFESTAEREELALRTLQRRYDDLRILAGTTTVEGDGAVFTITDANRLVTQDQLVDAVQELRDAGAEAIAVNDVRLVASSAFTTRNDRILLDRRPLDPPYRLVAIGPGETIAKALAIPGGAIDTLQVLAGVTAVAEIQADLVLPPVTEPPTFIFGTPIGAEETS